MRIKKRAVPLPVSLLSPARLLQLSANSPPPADDLLIGAASVSPVPIELKGYRNEKNKEKREDNNQTSKQGDKGAVSDNGGALPPPPPTPSNLTATEGRWCQLGDKAIPFKKRKVSLELEMSKIGASTKKMKSKTNKKCTLDHDNTSDSDYDNEDEKSKKKKKKKNLNKGKTRSTLGGKYSTSKDGRILMEGSRCSRVNGRGWRCMQPTLVGYSLCEHHLGKGRLRSISAVRVRAAASEKTSTAPASSTPPRASEVKTWCSDHHEEVINGKKKKRKVGMVKARSLSSLLCQPETKVVHPPQLHA